MLLMPILNIKIIYFSAAMYVFTNQIFQTNSRIAIDCLGNGSKCFYEYFAEYISI